MPGAPASLKNQAGGKHLPLSCLVGNRTGALRAVHAIGSRVLLLSPAAPRSAPALVSHFPWQPDEGETALPRLTRRLSRCPAPAAVIPLSERAVVAPASLAARPGGGDDAGWISAAGPDRDSVVRALAAARRALRFHLQPVRVRR